MSVCHVGVGADTTAESGDSISRKLPQADTALYALSHCPSSRGAFAPELKNQKCVVLELVRQKQPLVEH